MEWTGAYAFTETVDVIVTGDRKVIVHSATQAMGQGLETAYTQLIADKLGIDPALVTVLQGDTDLVKGPGSYGSRSAFVGGSAVAHGADDWVRTALPLAAEALIDRPRARPHRHLMLFGRRCPAATESFG